MISRLSVLVTPRAGLHYLEQLYGDIEKAGVRVRYMEGPTPSQTVNLLVAPGVLVWLRWRGFQILHIHWVFKFTLPWAHQHRWARLLMQWWFGLYLRTAELLGYAIVWTAHDLLPHQRVFEDDRRGRDLLIAKAKTIIALSEATAAELRALGARTIRVIPIGPYSGPYPVTLTRKEARASFGFHDDDVVMALIGRIESYKGADLLLVAAAQLPPTSHIKILLAGHCADQTYANNLQRLVRETNGRALSRLQWIADEELASYYQAADFAVFPFREITNSASVLLALSFEKPIIIPDLPTLGDIPDSAAIWFDPARGRLGDALLRAERLTDEERQEMSDVGYAWANRSDWSEIARDTIDAYEEALRR